MGRAVFVSSSWRLVWRWRRRGWMCWRAECRGCGDIISVSFLFVSRLGWAGRWRFVSSCGGCLVSRLVSRPVFSSRLRLFDWRSRVGVPFFVSCLRHVSSGVSCRCCPVALFLSARFLVSSRLFSSLRLLFSCSFRRACRVSGVFGVGSWERGGGGRCVVARCERRGVGCGVASCRLAVR